MKIPFEQGRSAYADHVCGNSAHNMPNFSIGGLKGRFASGKKKHIGRLDPFSNEAVVFSSEPAYENWLLRRFDTAVRDIDAERVTWSALHRGKHIEVRPHLFVQWKNRPPCLEFVAETQRPLSTHFLENIELVARAHGVEASVRKTSEIRSNHGLLACLEWLVQRVSLYASHSATKSMELELTCLLRRSRPWNRAAVLGALYLQHQQCNVSLVDAALMKMRHQGKIQVDLSSGEYGDGSIIEPLF